jgi:Trypsin-co-occurring domain 2
MTMEEEMRLSEAIKKLRKEIEEAQAEGEGKPIRFLPKSIEVELALVTKTEMQGNVGVKAWFVDASGKATSAGEATNKIKLTLEPVSASGKQTLVRDTEHERKTGTP